MLIKSIQIFEQTGISVVFVRKDARSFTFSFALREVNIALQQRKEVFRNGSFCFHIVKISFAH
jgi:hypothetical protein